MKAKSLLFTLLMSIGTIVNAQFYIGPRVGLNMANQATNSAGAVNTMKIGLSGGLTTKVKFSKYLSVNLDALFSQMGTNTEVTIDFPGTNEGEQIKQVNDYVNTWNYVHVPILLQSDWPIQSSKRLPYRQGKSIASFHLLGGGFFGYALGVSNSYTLTSQFKQPTDPNSPKILDIVLKGSGKVDSKGYNAIDFGIVAGIGFTFEMDPRNFVGFDARYLMGLANVATTKGITTTNSAIQVSLAYTYRLTTRNIRR
jgi:hypothetical protein